MSNTPTEIIETTVTTKALSEFLTADHGEIFGVYQNKTFAVGESIGNEITPDERPIAYVKCPGINNLDTSYFTDNFVTYNDVSGLYESIEHDQDGTVQAYTLAEVIADCCENGDVDDELNELINKLIEAVE